MAVEERERRQLQEALMGAIGSDHTDTLMSYLPPVGWADVATKRDLDALENALRGEMAELRGEMAEFRGEMRGEMGTLRADLHRELRLHFYAMATMVLALVALIVTLHLPGV